MSEKPDLTVRQIEPAREQIEAARAAIEHGELLNAHDALSLADLYLSGAEVP